MSGTGGGFHTVSDTMNTTLPQCRCAIVGVSSWHNQMGASTLTAITFLQAVTSISERVMRSKATPA